MKVLICGSRGWKDPVPMTTLLLGLKVQAEARGEDLVIIHGGAPGADRMADRIAKEHGIARRREDAQWDRYGKKAGPIRNALMLTKYRPNLTYAFRATGKSNGTDDMIEKSKEAGLPTYTITAPMPEEAQE